MDPNPPCPSDRLDIVYHLTTRLTSAKSLEEMFEAALDALMQGVAIDRASLLLFDAEGVMRFRMWRGLSREYRDAVDGHSPWTRDETAARPICIADVEADESVAELREVFRKEGIRALGFFPLVSKGCLIGKFMLYSNVARDWTPGEVLFVENVSANVAFAAELTRTEQTLRSANAQLASLAEHVPAGILFDSPEEEILFANSRFSTLFGLISDATLPGRSSLDLARDVKHLFKEPALFFEISDRLRSAGQSASGHEYELHDGRTVSQDYVPIHQDGAVVGHLWTFTDVTDRKRFEQQLIQAQRMESLGTLAGSLAHDFNNMLTPILGYGEILRRQLETGQARVEIVDELIHAGSRAAGVTRQLLAFARRQPISPQTLDFSHFLQSSLDLSRRLLGPEIELVFVDRSRQPLVDADPTQLQQVLINLIANARDAMPGGGELRLELSEHCLQEKDGHQGERGELEPGDYVVLVAKDNGCGMDEATRQRIFEPFFTTKAKGQGTGLGLSTCYGIVRQSGGDIQVESALGQGTELRIFMPRHRPGRTPSGGFEPLERKPRTGLKVLVVDDEPGVRRVLTQMLKLRDFEVLQAEDGAAALELLEAREGKVDVVLSDVLMPHMNGCQLLERLGERYPELPVVLMSGFSDSITLDRNVPFLAKPVHSAQVFDTITAAVGRRGRWRAEGEARERDRVAATATE